MSFCTQFFFHLDYPYALDRFVANNKKLFGFGCPMILPWQAILALCIASFLSYYYHISSSTTINDTQHTQRFAALSAMDKHNLRANLQHTKTSACKLAILDAYLKYRNQTRPQAIRNACPTRHNFQPFTSGANRAIVAQQYKKYVYPSEYETLMPLRAMHVAFVIYVHSNAEQVARLLCKIYRQEHVYVVHVDIKTDKGFVDELWQKLQHCTRNVVHDSPWRWNSSMYHKLSNVYIYSKVKVLWGGFSMVQVALDAMQQVLLFSHANDVSIDYVISLSGSDYPLQSVEEMVHELHWNAHLLGTRNVSYVDMIPLTPERHANLQNIYVECDDYVHHVAYRALPEYEKGTPMTFTGSSWWILHFGAVEYILSNETLLLQEFSSSLLNADEMFIQTALAYSPLCDSIITNVYRIFKFGERTIRECFGHISGDMCGNHPAILTRERDWVELSVHEAFFARKMHPLQSASLLDKLDSKISHKQYKKNIQHVMLLQDEECLTAISPHRLSFEACNELNTNQHFVIGPCSGTVHWNEHHNCLQIESWNETACAIRSGRFGTCLDVQYGSTEQGNMISLFECRMTSNQLFAFPLEADMPCILQPFLSTANYLPPLCVMRNDARQSALEIFACDSLPVFNWTIRQIVTH